ncbi:MAG: peptidoglycan bridge formation glycyltransferase FemA/FemB family protein [Anaerolineales bacterium]|nr:MAG: peptidoglycan bridge formation glycyltransferase FemA/FemB family protein [Anaerolineales bacterium]
MTIRIASVTSGSEWDMALACLPEAHVLQTWDWGDFKSRWGWQPTRLLFEEAGQPVAAAQILRRQLPRTPLSVTYIPKGPALDYDNAPLLAQVLSAVEQWARQKHSLFVKIDPDIWLGSGHKDALPLPRATSVMKTLAERGWRQSVEQIQFKNTVMVNLTLGEDELLARMKAKTRYNIRLTSRHGVRIRPGTKSDLQIFYNLYHETSERNQFLIRPWAYYLDVWGQFLQAGRAHLLLAEVEGEPVAGLVLFHFEQAAWYMYGASNNRHRNLMPNYLLQWEAMRLAKHLGCSRYDMWGAPDCFDESDPMYGVYRFKTGFGGETMRGLGAFDYSPSAWLYWIYTVAMPRLLALMRRQHQPKL